MRNDAAQQWYISGTMVSIYYTRRTSCITAGIIGSGKVKRAIYPYVLLDFNLPVKRSERSKMQRRRWPHVIIGSTPVDTIPPCGRVYQLRLEN